MEFTFHVAIFMLNQFKYVSKNTVLVIVRRESISRQARRKMSIKPGFNKLHQY